MLFGFTASVPVSCIVVEVVDIKGVELMEVMVCLVLWTVLHK